MSKCDICVLVFLSIVHFHAVYVIIRMCLSGSVIGLVVVAASHSELLLSVRVNKDTAHTKNNNKL